MKQVMFKPFPKQEEYLNMVLDQKNQKNFLMYGGAIRGGKTFVSLAGLMLLCRMFPGSRWAVCRKDLPTIKRNVVPVWEKLAPRPFFAPVNRTDWNVKAQNGSTVLFVPESLKDDRELMNFRGFEVNGFLLEEANEMSEAMHNVAIERAGTWIIPGLKTQPKPIVMHSCNPANNWVKARFRDPSVAGTLAPRYHFVQATAEDNPHITEEQKAIWKTLPEHLYRRYVLGDWNVSDDPLSVIPYEWLHPCVAWDGIADLVAALATDKPQTQYLGADYGGQGVDWTYLCKMLEGMMDDLPVALVWQLIGMHHATQGQVAQRITVEMQDFSIMPQNVGVDAVGEGSGVWGNLRDSGLNVRRIMAGGNPVKMPGSAADKAALLQYKNLKAQMWWTLRTDLQRTDSGLYLLPDQALIQDLTSVRYQPDNERQIVIESKESTRTRLGRSPDRGDAAVIANMLRHMPGSRDVFSWDMKKGKIHGREPVQEETGMDVDSLWNGFYHNE